MPQQIVRITRDAVSTHPRAGIKRRESIWFGRRRGDYLHDVDANFVSSVRELVHERDVHCPKRVFEQFRHLSDLGRGDHVQRAGGRRQHTGRLFTTRRSSAANHPRGALRRMVDHAGVDPLRTERDEHIHANLESPRPQRSHQQVCGASRIRGGCQDYDLARMRVFDHCRAGC
jgi:hypothetical protein